MDNDSLETVYGTHEDGHVMSDRVQALAANVYKEFERMIQRYDENVVKELMPLVVGILESLDASYREKQENDVELELLRDDNEQLLTQYEREKQLRKSSEQKYLEVEDATEEATKELQGKVESLESILRMFELKAKNAQDHISRLEEKETEWKKEYNKLHERYTELFKTHMDYMERSKLFMGGEKIMDSATSPRGRGFHLPNLRHVPNMGGYSTGETPDKTGSTPDAYNITSPSQGLDSNRSLRSELSDLEKAEINANVDIKEQKNNKNKSIDVGTKTDSIDVTERSIGTKAEAKTSAETSTERKEADSASAADTAAKTSELDIDRPFPGDGSKARDVVVDSVKLGVHVDRDKTVVSGDKSVAAAAEARGDATVVPSTPTSSSLSGSTEHLKTTFIGDMLTSPELEDIDEHGFGKSSALGIAGSKCAGNQSSIFDELSMQDADALGQVDDGVDITDESDQENERHSNVSDNFFGMSKEVENLILENTELLATKNALNVVKDDLIAKVDELTSEQEILREEIASLQSVKDKLKKRVSDLEDDLKKSKEELDKEKKKGGSQDETDDEVPMAQRKRFTRVEMARVLMERNQYKERLMELQEAVRWTEMIRASREHPELMQAGKKKSSIWNFFSNLFSSSPNKPSKRPAPSATIKYSAPTTNVRPVGDPNKKQREKSGGQKEKAYDFLQDDLLAEKARKEREKERREQYKQVRAHVKKDDGRMQAYGWSLPARYHAPSQKDTANKPQVPVPVPVYCRPLLDSNSGMKLWCAAGVNLSGGKTRDGGNIVGASVFYSSPPLESQPDGSGDEVQRLDQELQEHQKGIKELQSEQMSSLAWICTTAHNNSCVTVIDANHPAEVLESFHVTSSHILCIASVPGATESDYPADEAIKCEEGATPAKSDSATSSSSASTTESGEGPAVGGITLVQCAASVPSDSPVGTPPRGEGPSENSQSPGAFTTEPVPAAAEQSDGAASGADPSGAAEGESPGSDYIPMEQVRVVAAKASASSSGRSSPMPEAPPGITSKRLLIKEPNELVRDGLNSVSMDTDYVFDEVEKMNSVLPTMWLGSQSGSLYVHSAVSQWKRCLHSVKLKDSVLNIMHVKGRVFVALADGTVAVFHRGPDGQWDLTNYHVIDLGRPHHSVRCMCVIANKHVWCGYRNKVHVLDPKTLKVEKTFDAHPRKESQIRQMAWIGDGVWISIRLDSTLRLYHAYTHQHLQDVDIEPYVSKMLGTGKLGFSFVRITSLLASCNRLWIGTGNGVIISVPLSEQNKQAVTTATAGRPGGVVRVYQDTKTESVTPGSFIPYCSMAQAQLSFHGHRDAVKFFVSVPGAPSKGVSGVATSAEDSSTKTKSEQSSKPNKTMLVISGGEGYVDFRMGDADEEVEGQDEEKKALGISKGERSHLVVWQVNYTPERVTAKPQHVERQ